MNKTMKYFLIAICLVSSMMVVSCKQSNEVPKDAPKNETNVEKTASTQHSDSKGVTFEQVSKLVEDPDVLIIDARKPEEFAQGHLKGAKNFYAMEFEKHIPELLGMNLPADKRIVVYCGGGECELSHMISDQLTKQFKFTNVFIYLNGWKEWTEKGGAVSK